jgi:thermitase
MARVVTDELLVTFQARARVVVLRRIRSEPGVEVVGSLMRMPVVLVRVRALRQEQMVRRLRSVAGVVSVQSDAVESPVAIACPSGGGCVIPNDPGFGYQWYLLNAPGTVEPSADTPIYGADVDGPEAWLRTRGSAAVRIAVIDTGIDAAHPDLAGKVDAAANFTASDTTQDLSGHGTHVAGIAAASFDNGIGIAGMAPNARLMDVKVLAVDQNGQTAGDCADVADGIVWATNHGANVLNLSLGSPSPCSAMELAVRYAVSHGALVVAAAGNDGSTSRFYPAGFSDVLSVAATTNRDQLAGFSNRGASWVDVAAPGDGIASTLPTFDNGTGAVGYGYLSGTSMAAPVVSGIAALIWGQMPSQTARQDVESRIIATAQPITGTGIDFRYGRVDACAAATGNRRLCAAPAAPAPSPAPPAPGPPQTARPAPIVTAPPATPPRNAAPGTYTGSLARGAGRLRLVVGDGGDALLRVQGTVQARCDRRAMLRVRIGALSTTDYGRVRRGGAFGLRTAKVTSMLRRPRLELAGQFNVRRKQASGTVRVTGRVRNMARCDSRVIRWSVRRAG